MEFYFLIFLMKQSRRKLFFDEAVCRVPRLGEEGKFLILDGVKSLKN